MSRSKVQLNSDQIKLAKQWLNKDNKDCEPYAHDSKMLWFWETTPTGPVKNAVKLSLAQVQQLEQLN